MKGALEDVVVGETITLGSHAFTREDIVRFAAAFDPQPFHLDDEAAAATHFGRLAASGWHTASVWMRLYVEWYLARQRDGLLSPGVPGPSPGFTDLRWPRPVFPGDVVTYTSRVTAKRRVSRPGWGLLSLHNGAVNQDGAPVMAFDCVAFWRARGD